MKVVSGAEIFLRLCCAVYAKSMLNSRMQKNENFETLDCLLKISAEYMFLYIGRYKTLHISRQYKPQA